MATGTHGYQDVMQRFEKRGETRGEKRGEAKALLRTLRARGFDIPENVERRVLDCTDTAQLENWIDRAVTISNIDELFDTESAAS